MTSRKINKGFTLISKACKSEQNSGFTLIELLVVIVIIAIVSGISIFGIQGARESGRDAKRKSDLASLQSALELYRSDCNSYPASITAGSSIQGTGSPASCANTNVYMEEVPDDPQGAPDYRYRRFGTGGTRYALCAALEQSPAPAMDLTDCGGTGCGSATCNYIVKSP